MLFVQGVGEHIADDETSARQAGGPVESLDPVFDRLWVDAVVEVMEANAELGKRLLDDERFASLVRLLLRQVAHRRARDEPPRARPSPVA